MQRLTHLILPTFCTNNILNALARTCKVSKTVEYKNLQV
jgi:hypothetical protein